MDWTKEAQKYIDTHWRVEGKLAEFMASFASEVERINSCKEWKVDNSEASESRQRVLEQALREIGSEGCRVWHQGEGGPTCLGVVAHAKAHPEKYDKKFHAEIMSQKYLCGPCRAESALAQGEPARTEEK